MVISESQISLPEGMQNIPMDPSTFWEDTQPSKSYRLLPEKNATGFIGHHTVMRPEIPLISTNKTPFIECIQQSIIIPLILTNGHGCRAWCECGVRKDPNMNASSLFPEVLWHIFSTGRDEVRVISHLWKLGSRMFIGNRLFWKHRHWK